MSEINLQKQLFNHIKNILPSNVSIIDVLADTLDLSNDSVYRRVRGEKPISIDEVKILCEKFSISLDQVLQIQNNAILFQAPDINDPKQEIIDYLKGVLGQVKYFNSFEHVEMRYQCKDATFFYFFLYPEIAAFKTFCWLRTILNHPEYQDKVFSLAEYPFEDCYIIGQQIIKEYNQIPSIELWTLESLNSSIKQIKYYKEAHLFRNEADFAKVIASLKNVVMHIQRQAEEGYKFLPSEGPGIAKNSVAFYVNDVILGNNTINITLNGKRLSILTYNAINYMHTYDERFTKVAFDSFDVLISRSTLISRSGEKDRNRFLRALLDKVDKLIS